MEILLLLPFLAFFAWLYAEVKLGTGYRVVCGLLCIGLTGFACHFLAKIIPRYESSLHRSSLRLAGELFTKGEIKRVAQAIQSYNSTVTNKNTYAASMKMWEVLNHDPDK